MLRKQNTPKVLRGGYLLLLLVLIGGNLNAQQEQQYTQFMFNKLSYNPGYAGSFESPTLSVVYRNQWMGIEGAPQTQLLSYTQPLLNNRLGLGVALVRNTIGISTSTTLEGSYSYRIDLGQGILGVGIQGSARNLRQNWNDDRLRGSQPILTDNAIPLEPKSKIIANVGFGLFYTGETWYAGISAPRLVTNNIDFAEFGSVFSREERHLNGMFGLSIDLADQVEFTPQILFKYVKNAPLDADVSTSIFVKRKFLGGVSYRVGGNSGGGGESLDLMFGLQATRQLFFCLSYDIGISKLRTQHNGSVEATARWWFNVPEGEDVVDPLYPW
jgi:type IX secretion system PorP/SprF family membrane protein